jgi:hypothetical protein
MCSKESHQEFPWWWQRGVAGVPRTPRRPRSASPDADGGGGMAARRRDDATEPAADPAAEDGTPGLSAQAQPHGVPACWRFLF